MRRLLVIAALLPALAAPGSAPAADAVDGRLIVGFAPGTSADRRDALLERVKARVVRRLGSIGAAAVAPRDGRGVAALRKALRRSSLVAYTEPDWILDASKTPNDPDYPAQYALAESGAGASGAPAAWDTATSCANVAVLDSGIQYSHPDLQGNVWHNPDEVKANGKDDDKNGYVDDYYGVNLVEGHGSGTDDNGHGTHVAGIIGGRGNNGTGVSGLCWSVHLLAVKFLNANGRGATSGAVAAIEYAIRAGARILNGSFGSSAESKALADAVEYAQEKGALLVFAAGNDGEDIEDEPLYPASYTRGNILAVAATTSSASLASFSNYGATSVDLGAAGDKVYSTYLGSAYKKLSGTSMASPLVAAAAALLRARDKSRSYSDIRTAIRTTATPNRALKGKTVTGGLLDVDAALEAFLRR